MYGLQAGSANYVIAAAAPAGNQGKRLLPQRWRRKLNPAYRFLAGITGLDGQTSRSQGAQSACKTQCSQYEEPMLISHSHQFIFVHISKTAGTSLRRVLDPYCSQPPRVGVRKLLSHLPVREDPYKVRVPAACHRALGAPETLAARVRFLYPILGGAQSVRSRGVQLPFRATAPVPSHAHARQGPDIRRLSRFPQGVAAGRTIRRRGRGWSTATAICCAIRSCVSRPWMKTSKRCAAS